MKPARLFHYKPFVEAHLSSLLSAGQLKLSRPDNFNDPWDCRVHYQVPREPDEKKRVSEYLMEVYRKLDPSISEAKLQRLVIRIMENPSKLEATFVQLEENMYAASCRRYRIYCLVENPASPLMWGHYAESHTGICLEFDAQCHPFSEVEKVEYRDTYPARDLSTVHYEPLITKSKHWAYEAEWRLIAEDRAAPIPLSLVTIKTDDDFLTIASGVLKSVTIGARADEPTRRRIQNVVKSHARGVLVRQATVARDRYGLEISPPF